MSTSAATTDVDRSAPKRGSLLRRFLSRPAGAISTAVFLIIVLVAIFAPWLSPYDPNAIDFTITKAPPSPEHLLGGDSTGRDVLSRLLWGTQFTLVGAFISVVVAVVIGVPFGVAAGYYGGVFDRISTWISDALQSLPGMIILLIVAAGTRQDFTWIMITVGVLMTPGYFRLSRSTTLSVRNETFVDAAKVAGLSDIRIMGTHVVKSVYAPIIIQTGLTGGMAMAMQAGLQFLGIGSSDTPAWGAMMNEGFRLTLTAPYLLLWPSIALGVSIAALAIMGSTFAEVVRVRTPKATKKGKRIVGDPPTTSTGSVVHAPEDSAVRLENLRVSYEGASGATEVVHGITLDVAPGEVLGIVGESGSGKSQTVFSMLDLLPEGGLCTADAIWVDGKEVTTLSHKQRRASLGRTIGYIPQEPMTNLDPSYTIGYQLIEPLRAVLGFTKKNARERAIAMLTRVGIPEPERVMRSYPHEISGGMAQRVLIAGAVAAQPSVLVADEPTTALDVTVQAEVLELLRELQEEYDLALVIVTHNFGVVADICDRVVVMRSGNIEEVGEVHEVFRDPESEYTRTLISSSLDNTPTRAELDAAHEDTRKAERV